MLRDAQHHVIPVRGGRAALQAAKAEAYEVIVLGVRLLEGEELDFLEKLMKRDAAVPVVIRMSAQSRVGDVTLESGRSPDRVASDMEELKFLIWQVLNSD